MWKRIRHWWKAEGDMVQLQGVSDRMLADMGLERDGLRSRILGGTGPEPATPNAGSLGRSGSVPLACRC